MNRYELKIVLSGKTLDHRVEINDILRTEGINQELALIQEDLRYGRECFRIIKVFLESGGTWEEANRIIREC